MDTQQSASKLEQLRDIHLPDAVSWWPPAPGWWWLAGGVFLLLCLVAGYAGFKRRQRTCNRLTWPELIVAAQGELAQLRHQYAAADSPQETMAALSALMKRVAMQHPRAQENPAGLTGKDWLLWLDVQWHEGGFCEQAGSYFLEAAYGNEATRDPEADGRLFMLCQRWLEAQQ